MNHNDLNIGISKEHDSREEYWKETENVTLNNFNLKKIFKQKANEKQLSFITENLAQIYKAGIPITTAIELVIDILPNKIYKDSLNGVLTQVKHGKNLSEGFAKFKDLYPEFFVGIVMIGESTGKLYLMLKALSTFYKKLEFIKTEIKSASAYPIFVLVSLGILSIFLVNEIIPNFSEIYKSMNIPLPASCKFLYDINITLKNEPILAAIRITSWLLIIVIISMLIYKKLNTNILIKMQIVKSFFEYLMILILSIITSAGINISEGLEYCEKSINFVYLRNKIKEINTNIIEGRTLTESLEVSRVFSKYSLAIIRINEESGSIDEGLRELAEDLENKLSMQIKKYLKLINPIFIFIMAGFIVAFLLTFVLPLFDNLQSGVKR